MPRAYLVFNDTTPIAFIPSGVRGLWRQTHGCVLVAACPYCDAAVGACCVGANGQPCSSTHCARRDAAKAQLQALRRHGPHVTIVIKPGSAPPVPPEEVPGSAPSVPPEEVPDAQPQA